MLAPANELAFDLKIARAAAEHWEQREPERRQKDKAVDAKRYDEADTKERLAKRINHLLGKVGRAVPAGDPTAMPETLQAMVNNHHMHVTPAEVDNLLVERVIGETRDFLSVEFLERALEVSRCVGRVVTRLPGGRVSYGTGFMVSPRLLMTNNHVLPSADEAAGSVIEFDYQKDRFGRTMTAHEFALDPATFFATDKGLDFALVAVADTSRHGRRLVGVGHCPLIGAEGKISIGECINIVQHPRGEMKQIVIRENQLFDLPDKPLDWAAHYGADTEPGSSGSPVFNDQWEVFALHHSAVPKRDAGGNILNKKGKVWKPGDDPTSIEWVANEGIRVSRLVAYLKTLSLRGQARDLLAQMLLATPPAPRPDPGPVEPPVVDPAEVGTTGTGTNFMSRSSRGAVSLTIPLNISVSLGEPATGGAEDDENGESGARRPARAVRLPAAARAAEKIEPDEDYDNRPGYDPDFLGFRVPLPKLTNSIRSKAFTLDGGGAGATELKYHHYSLIMNRERRLAFVAAVNFDAGARVRHKREDGDRWFVDPRVPDDLQTDDGHYAANPLDRGHLVRRADAAWGDAAAEAKRANDDTFHFTNCSPQHEIFNQSSKANQRNLKLWGNLEEHIARQAGRGENKKVCVMNGPVFRANDRAHRDLPVPREYWKVVVYEGDDGGPRAAAFVLSQADQIANLPAEAFAEEFEPGEFRPFQVKVVDLESRTKLNFGEVRSWDALEQEGAEESFGVSGVDPIPIGAPGDAIL